MNVAWCGLGIRRKMRTGYGAWTSVTCPGLLPGSDCLGRDPGKCIFQVLLVRGQAGYIRIMAQTRRRRPMSPRLAAARPGPIDRRLSPERFKALADPTRASLLACIAKCGRACSVGEVAQCSSVDLSVVSRHLATLARAGLLASSKEGRTVLYRVRYAELCGWLRGLADALEACSPEKGPKVRGVHRRGR